MHLFSSLPFPPPPPSRSLPPPSCSHLSHRKILPHYKYPLSPLAATQKPCFAQNRNILHPLYVYNVDRDGLSDIFDNKEILGTRISQRVESKIAPIYFLYFSKISLLKTSSSFFFLLSFLYNKNLCRMKIGFDKYVWFLSLGSGN